MNYVGMQIEILELFVEAQHRAPPRKMCMWRADVRRTKQRGYVLDHELRLLLSMRQGTQVVRCPVCGSLAEQRVGCKTLSRHRVGTRWCSGLAAPKSIDEKRAYNRNWMRAKRAG